MKCFTWKATFETLTKSVVMGVPVHSLSQELVISRKEGSEKKQEGPNNDPEKLDTTPSCTCCCGQGGIYVDDDECFEDVDMCYERDMVD